MALVAAVFLAAGGSLYAGTAAAESGRGFADDEFMRIVATVGGECHSTGEDRWQCVENGMPIEVVAWRRPDISRYVTRSSAGFTVLNVASTSSAYAALVDEFSQSKLPMYVDGGRIVYYGWIPQMPAIADELGLVRYVPPQPAPGATAEGAG